MRNIMKDSFKEIENIGGKKIQKESKEDRELRIADNYKNYNSKIREQETLKELSLDEFQRNFVEAYSAVTKNSWNKESRARGAILQLSEWFSGQITKQNLSQDKGVFLYGDFGTGKSSIMKAFNLLSTTKKFKIKSAKDIAKAYAGDASLEEKGGYAAISRYNDITTKNGTAVGWLFDDLGAESVVKHYGQEENVMADIIISLYDKGHKGKIHVTSNLHPEELTAKYGNRAASRMMEMFNFIHIVEVRDWRSDQ
jgi:DNA replication protein DnaC